MAAAARAAARAVLARAAATAAAETGVARGEVVTGVADRKPDPGKGYRAAQALLHSTLAWWPGRSSSRIPLRIQMSTDASLRHAAPAHAEFPAARCCSSIPPHGLPHERSHPRSSSRRRSNRRGNLGARQLSQQTHARQERLAAVARAAQKRRKKAFGVLSNACVASGRRRRAEGQARKSSK